MNVYIGLDVSLASTAICVLDEKGKIVTEAQVASTPEGLVSFMGKLEHEVAAIGLVGRALGLVIVGGARDPHQSASFGDGEAFGPVMTDMDALLGRRPCR